MMAPVWSPDGSKIAVTSDNYQGIWVANADGSNLRQITTDLGAGYKMVWSADSKEILARPNEVVNLKKVYSVKTYNVNTGKATTLVSKTRAIKGTPTWKSVNQEAKAMKRVNANTSLYEKMVSNPAEVTSTVSALAQFSGKILMNPTISADNSKIAFQILGKGLWVCNADGSNLQSLGNYVRPAWMPDNKTIVAALTKDNGTAFTASDIYAINIANGNQTNLTSKTNIIAFAPAVSPDGKRIAVENCIDGGIYIMDLKY